MSGQPSEPKSNIKSVALLLLVSGLLGFVLGAFAFRAEQTCVEFGQVFAGLVKYPPESTQGLILQHTWCLTVQLAAWGLQAGLTEFALTFLISGLIGMLSFQALAVFIFAINGRLWIAVLAPALFLYARTINYGVIYPVELMGTPSTNGAIGLSYVLLTIALFGLGWNRTAALLLGVAPAWHLVIGGLMWGVVPLAWLATHKRPWRQHLLPVVGWFAAGAVVALVTFVAQRWRMPPLPDISPEEVKRHLVFFIENWDYHRRPVVLMSAEILLNLLGLAVCIVALKGKVAAWPERLRFMFHILLVAGGLAIGFALLTHLPVTALPLAFARAMPARLLNVLVLTFSALVLALLTRERSEGPDQLFGAVFILLLVVAVFLPPVMLSPFVLCALVLGGALVMLCLARAAGSSAGLSEFAEFRPWLQRGQVALFAVFATYALGQSRAFFSWDKLRRVQSVYEDTYRQAEHLADDLLLAASNLDMPQYATRKPILLDVRALDNLPYAPKFGPAMAAILREVYGVDFFNPPVESRGKGQLEPPGIERQLWESRSLEQWQDLRRKYQVVHVLAPSKWKLHLPVRARIHLGIIYDIPQPESPAS